MLAGSCDDEPESVKLCISGDLGRYRLEKVEPLPDNNGCLASYRDPAGIDISQWQGKEAEGRLYVPKAGEMLYKLKNPPAWQRFDG